MKRIFTIIMLLSFSCSYSRVFSQAQHYEITGRIEGAEGMKFVLQKNISGRAVVLDTTVVINGGFKITGGSVEYPEPVSLVTLDRKKGFMFFLENTNLEINGKFDSLSKVVVSGSKSNDEYTAYLKSLDPQSKKIAKAEEDYKKITDEVMKEIKNSQIDFVRKNPGSFVTPFILRNIITDMKAEEIESIIKNMDPAVADSPEMKDISSKVAAMISVASGKIAPDFRLKDVDGNDVVLSSRIGTKLLLIDFWAGWCRPCRLENPNVLKAYKEFHKNGFDIIGVSLDRTKDEWIKAIADDKLPWTQVSDLKYFNSPVAKLYNVTSIPANFLLDEKGIIIATNLRGDALYTKIKELLGKK
jgi:peroxiredoxin